jgi:hypothetical protein
VADFNGDGKLDVAVTAGESLVIFLGNGDGTFNQFASYPGVFYSIAVADFNNDGIPDLVVTSGTSSVSVFLGNGDGTFEPPKTSSTTEYCAFVAVGDFNGDHKTDLAIIDSPYISVLLGNGDGTFQAPIDNSSFVGQRSLTVGDFNKDHVLDVAVVGSFDTSSNIGVLLGNGDGTLQPSLTYPLASSTPLTIAAADFNRDGNLDAAVGYEFGDVGVILGKGDGSFLTEVDYFTYGGTQEIFAVDFNGDGAPDLASSASLPPGVNELVNQGDGTFKLEQFFPVGLFPADLGIGDFNGDHKPDILYLDRTVGATTLLNTGALALSPTTPLSFSPAQLVGTTSAPVTVKLANGGGTEISMRPEKASAQFGATDDCGGAIAAGASCNLSVMFEPTTAGPQSGLIKLYDSASSKPQVVEVSGRGTFVALSPNPLKFADQKVGTQSSPQQFAITNDGTKPLTISKVGISGVDPKDFPLSETANCVNKTLGAGGTCDVLVTFAPTKSGRLSATILAHDTGAGSPEIATLSGTGTK